MDHRPRTDPPQPRRRGHGLAASLGPGTSYRQARGIAGLRRVVAVAALGPTWDVPTVSTAGPNPGMCAPTMRVTCLTRSASHHGTAQPRAATERARTRGLAATLSSPLPIVFVLLIWINDPQIASMQIASE